MYIQKCIHNYTYTYTYVYTYTYTHMHIYIYIYTYTYIHVYLHTCMHACIHTYMDTWSLGRKMRTEACLMRREKRRRKQQQQVVNKNRKAGPAKGSKCQKMSTVTSLWVKNIAMVVISCVFLAVWAQAGEGGVGGQRLLSASRRGALLPGTKLPLDTTPDCLFFCKQWTRAYHPKFQLQVRLHWVSTEVCSGMVSSGFLAQTQVRARSTMQPNAFLTLCQHPLHTGSSLLRLIQFSSRMLPEATPRRAFGARFMLNCLTERLREILIFRAGITNDINASRKNRRLYLGRKPRL